MQVKKQQLELDMEQQTGLKSGKGYVKVVYCHQHKLESGFPGEIAVTSDMQMTPPLWQKVKD